MPFAPMIAVVELSTINVTILHFPLVVLSAQPAAGNGPATTIYNAALRTNFHPKIATRQRVTMPAVALQMLYAVPVPLVGIGASLD